MLTEKIITIPIYNYTLKIVVANSMDEAYNKYSDIPGGAKGALLDYGDKSMIVVPPDDIPTVIHECEHAKNAIWKRIGFIPTPENDEPDAYLLEYLFKEVMKVVKKHLAHQC